METLDSFKTSTSLEDLEGNKEQENSSGAKKKSPINGINTVGGTKKKIRSKSGKSPSKEYLQIWNASSPSPEDENKTLESTFVMDFGDEAAPPLPPRSFHRPLKRTPAVCK